MFINFLQLQTFWQLIVCNFHTFKPRIKDQILNSLIWTSINITVFGYFMTTRGISTDYGPFIAVSMACVQGFVVPMYNIVILISDMSNESSNLHYELTLPIPQWSIFLKYALANAYQAFIVTLCIVPFGKILLWNSFSFHYFSFVKFYFLLILICLFAGFFSLFISSKMSHFFQMQNLWSRILFPMWFLGGFQYSWHDLYQISPKLAYIVLCNPVTYALEGGRAATLDPALSLPYWNCVLALIGFTFLFGYLGIANLKQRMDCL